MSHWTPDRLIAVCGDAIFKKKKQTYTSENEGSVKMKCSGGMDENTNTILRIDSGLTLSTKQRIFLDIGEEKRNRKGLRNDALDITKRSRIFSFTFSTVETQSRPSDCDQISPGEPHPTDPQTGDEQYATRRLHHISI